VSKLIHTPSHEPLTSMHSRVNYWRAWHLSITRECMRVYSVLFMQRRRCTRGHAQAHARSPVLDPDINKRRTAVERVCEGSNVTYNVRCGSCVQCERAAVQRRHCSSFFLHRLRDERARATYDVTFASVRPVFGSERWKVERVYSTSKHVSSCDPIPLYLL